MLKLLYGLQESSKYLYPASHPVMSFGNLKLATVGLFNLEKSENVRAQPGPQKFSDKAFFSLVFVTKVVFFTLPSLPNWKLGPTCGIGQRSAERRIVT